MSDPIVLLQIAAAVALTVVPLVVVIRVLAGADAGQPEGDRARLPWPTGVQEEDVVRFKLRPIV